MFSRVDVDCLQVSFLDPAGHDISGCAEHHTDKNMFLKVLPVQTYLEHSFSDILKSNVMFQSFGGVSECVLPSDSSSGPGSSSSLSLGAAWNLCHNLLKR